jgi:hypothetical protein
MKTDKKLEAQDDQEIVQISVVVEVLVTQLPRVVLAVGEPTVQQNLKRNHSTCKAVSVAVYLRKKMNVNLLMNVS